MSISSSDVKKLREQTGAGMLDCKAALEEAVGDTEKAVEILREKGALKAAKRAEKVAAEGVIVSYIHAGGKIGVLVEVNCETDFVARTDVFRAFANDIAMHIAATAPKYVSREEVLEEQIEAEKRIYLAQAQTEGKPADIAERMMEGKLNKFFAEVCLLEQPFIKDEDKTIQALLGEKTSEMGEKISVRRFVRYELGEGIEREKVDFVKEVQAQITLAP